jgi:hypothetical protein
MKITSYITRKFELLRNTIAKTLNVEPINPMKELDHTRFHVNENFDTKVKKNANSLLFHMYSKENETLFI